MTGTGERILNPLKHKPVLDACSEKTLSAGTTQTKIASFDQAERLGVEDPFLTEDICASAHLSFGIEQLRAFQLQTILKLVQGEDALVVQPTAAGKSLCYQIPAIMLRGTVLVISPLLSLMEQQSNALKRQGIEATFLNGDLSSTEIAVIEKRFESGAYDLLFVAPERLGSQHFINLATRAPLVMVAIDEAHCLTTWGHDFRPDYQRIGQFVTQLRTVKGQATKRSIGHTRLPVLALTATADKQTQNDIRTQLSLQTGVNSGEADHVKKEPLLIKPPHRHNLHFSVGYRRNGYKQVLSLLQDRFAGKRGIVYCPTRALVERLTTALNENHVSALPYHAGLSRDLRSLNQQLFELGQVDVMVATLAFGMGVDAPDLEFVLRLGLPQTFESFLQEAGRAGRDGRDADVLTLFNERDAAWVWARTGENGAGHTGSTGESDDKLIPRKQARLQALIDLLLGKSCVHALVDQHFGANGQGLKQTPDCTCPKCFAENTRDKAVGNTEWLEGEVLQAGLLDAFQRIDIAVSPATLIDFVTGKETEKLRGYGLHQLPEFACMTGEGRLPLMIAIRDLIAARALNLDLETTYLSNAS